MYDFSKITNRFNTNSYKWDVKENELPMWVADMDFETAPAIINALHKRIIKSLVIIRYLMIILKLIKIGGKDDIIFIWKKNG